MCLTFHIRVVHFFGMLKKKSIYINIYVYFHKKCFFLGLSNLTAQIGSAQNWYNAVQMDLKYPLRIFHLTRILKMFLTMLKSFIPTYQFQQDSTDYILCRIYHKKELAAFCKKPIFKKILIKLTKESVFFLSIIGFLSRSKHA